MLKSLMSSSAFNWRYKVLDVNELDRSDMTALDVAIAHDKIDVVKYLIKHPEVDVNVGGGQFKSSLNLAVEHLSVKVVSLFLNPVSIGRLSKGNQSKPDFSICDAHRNNAFHILAKQYP